MPTAEATEQYLDVPSHAGARPQNVAPRTVLMTSVGGSTIVRSSNPKGYLIPDVGSFVSPGALDGTMRPDATTIMIADAGIVIRISAPDEIAEQIFPALLRNRLGFVATTHPSQDHITSLGLAGLYGSYGALGCIIGVGPPVVAPTPEASGVIVGLLEDASTCRRTLETDPILESSTAAPQTIGADASIAEIATRIAAITGLNDGELARVFKVARETFQRWRTGELTKPNVANRRRLGLLHRLLEDLADREVRVNQWLHNVSDIESLTPYDLLERGRLDDVEYLAARLPTGSPPRSETALDGSPVTRADAHPAFAPRRDEPLADLPPADEDGWEEVEAETIDDDE
jgi:hypothetical protein